MTITEISELIGLITTGVGLIITLVKWLKELKTKKLKELIEKYMELAGESSMTNPEKKIYVVSNVIMELKIKSQKKTDEIKAYIEECMDFANRVKGKKKK